jgi:hypothetical protein
MYTGLGGDEERIPEKGVSL